MSEPTNNNFKELDGATLFTAPYYWEWQDPITQEVKTRSAVGMWAWEDIRSVSTIEPEVLKALPEPRCSVIWGNDYIYLPVPYQVVATAWRRWRQRYGANSLTYLKAN